MKSNRYGVLDMLMGGYTTDQLEQYMNKRPWRLDKVSLEERPEGLFWMNEPVPVRRIPVYLAPEDPRRKASATRYLDFDDYGEDMGVKRVWLPHNCFYRCQQTLAKWQRPCLYQYTTMCNDADWVELLYLDEDQVRLERYELTADPMKENPTEQEFEYVRHLGVLTITGVKYYCERLHIPAQLDGVPVANVFLPSSMNTCYLRELSVAEGIQKLDFQFGLPELAFIDIPSSVRLVRAPDGIRYSAWFKNQPDGLVFFQNYYCGTKGVPEEDALILPEGTLGVIQWADDRQTWRKISIPSTLTHIGSWGFNAGRHLQEVVIPEGSEQLKGYFTYQYPFYVNWIRKQRKENSVERLPDGIQLDGKTLYELGRNSRAVREKMPWEWLPTAPRLRYENGWIAEFWYCTEIARQVGYYAAFRLPSGEPVEVQKLDENAHAAFVGFWTDTYLPPQYLKTEDYLECCAAAIRGGEPTAEILEQLTAWWESLMPQQLLELLGDKSTKEES